MAQGRKSLKEFGEWVHHPNHIVPVFDYGQPGIILDNGDEFYEVELFDDDGNNITPDLKDPTLLPTHDGAISVAQSVVEKGWPTAKTVLVTVYGEKYPDGSAVPKEKNVIWDSRFYEGLDDPFSKGLKSEDIPDEAWCYPPHQDDDWRLCAQATNAWMGTIEDRTGEELLDLTAWASQDFQAAFSFAQDTVKRYNNRFGITIPDYE